MKYTDPDTSTLQQRSRGSRLNGLRPIQFLREPGLIRSLRKLFQDHRALAVILFIPQGLESIHDLLRKII